MVKLCQGFESTKLRMSLPSCLFEIGELLRSRPRPPGNPGLPEVLPQPGSEFPSALGPPNLRPVVRALPSPRPPEPILPKKIPQNESSPEIRRARYRTLIASILSTLSAVITIFAFMTGIGSFASLKEHWRDVWKAYLPTPRPATFSLRRNFNIVARLLRY